MDIMKFGHNSLIVWTEADLRQERIKEKQMSREIKFRGLTKDGKWVYGYYVFCRHDHYILPDNDAAGFDERWIQEGADEDGWIKVIPETVGQYTGLKDKNGKEIYHHDIVKWTHQTDADKHFTKAVEWSNEKAGWILSGHPMNRIDLFSPETNLEIIGNVSQNPELMEQGNGK